MVKVYSTVFGQRSRRPVDGTVRPEGRNQGHSPRPLDAGRGVPALTANSSTINVEKPGRLEGGTGEPDSKRKKL